MRHVYDDIFILDHSGGIGHIMMGRLDLKQIDCVICHGTGTDLKKRSRMCPNCSGTGKTTICESCGKLYPEDGLEN